MWSGENPDVAVVPVLVDTGFALVDDERVFVAVRQVEASRRELHFVLIVDVADDRLKRLAAGARSGLTEMLPEGFRLEIDFGAGVVGRLEPDARRSFTAARRVFVGPGNGSDKRMSYAARIAIPQDFDSVVFRLSWPQAEIREVSRSVPGGAVQRAASEALDATSVSGLREL